MVKVYEQIDEFEGASTVFQTSAWLRAAWTHLLEDGKNRLWIAKWTEEKSDAFVLLPGYIDGKDCLRFINDAHSDMGGCVVSPGANVHYAFKEIAEAIQEDKRIKSVWLQKLPGGDAALDALGVFLKGSVIYRDNAYSWVESEKCDDFIVAQAQLKSKDKADLKAIRRKAEKDGELVVLRGGADAYPEETVQRLVAHMMAAEGRQARKFFPKGMDSFTRAIYEAGMADIILLKRAGEVVALNFLLKRGESYLSWIFLYTDARGSSQMYVKYLTERAKESAFKFNFGVGVYDYKIGSFRPRTALTFSLRYHKSFWGRVWDVFLADVRLGLDVLRSRG